MKFNREFFKWLGSHILIFSVLFLVIAACSSLTTQSLLSPADSISAGSVPKFDHVVVITFENKAYQKVIGNPYMPTFNRYARDYTLLTQFYAVTHPSLPNYIAMVGGNTFDIQENCVDCFIDAPSLPDLIEASGRTWKTYQEDMQTPCGLGSQDDNEYVQKHNPFVYFDSIRLDEARCNRSVVPLKDLQKDIDAGTLPNFVFITPNICNDAHDCKALVTDAWLHDFADRLIPALEKESSNYLIVLNWDEGQDDTSCCGLPELGGGRIAVVLISPLVKKHFQDSTPYSHYSLLKTISKSWDLQYLGHAGQDNTALILAPWK
jgi:phospholipase C